MANFGVSPYMIQLARQRASKDLLTQQQDFDKEKSWRDLGQNAIGSVLQGGIGLAVKAGADYLPTAVANRALTGAKTGLTNANTGYVNENTTGLAATNAQDARARKDAWNELYLKRGVEQDSSMDDNGQPPSQGTAMANRVLGSSGGVDSPGTAPGLSKEDMVPPPHVAYSPNSVTGGTKVAPTPDAGTPSLARQNQQVDYQGARNLDEANSEDATARMAARTQVQPDTRGAGVRAAEDVLGSAGRYSPKYQPNSVMGDPARGTGANPSPIDPLAADTMRRTASFTQEQRGQGGLHSPQGGIESDASTSYNGAASPVAAQAPAPSQDKTPTAATKQSSGGPSLHPETEAYIRANGGTDADVLRAVYMKLAQQKAAKAAAVQQDVENQAKGMTAQGILAKGIGTDKFMVQNGKRKAEVSGKPIAYDAKKFNAADLGASFSDRSLGMPQLPTAPMGSGGGKKPDDTIGVVDPATGKIVPYSDLQASSALREIIQQKTAAGDTEGARAAMGALTQFQSNPKDMSIRGDVHTLINNRGQARQGTPGIADVNPNEKKWKPNDPLAPFHKAYARNTQAINQLLRVAGTDTTGTSNIMHTENGSSRRVAFTPEQTAEYQRLVAANGRLSKFLDPTGSGATAPAQGATRPDKATMIRQLMAQPGATQESVTAALKAQGY